MAHLIAGMYLKINNIEFSLSYKEATQFIIDIAHKKKTLSEIEEWIRNYAK